MDAKGYREAILTTLTTLSRDGFDIKELKAQAEKETDPRKLFLMYQSLREVLNEQSGGQADTSFEIFGPDREKIKVNTIAEGAALVTEKYAKRRKR